MGISGQVCVEVFVVLLRVFSVHNPLFTNLRLNWFVVKVDTLIRFRPSWPVSVELKSLSLNFDVILFEVLDGVLFGFKDLVLNLLEQLLKLVLLKVIGLVLRVSIHFCGFFPELSSVEFLLHIRINFTFILASFCSLS